MNEIDEIKLREIEKEIARQMGVDTITVRSHEDTAFALRGILGLLGIVL